MPFVSRENSTQKENSMRATKHTNLRPANLTVIVAIVGLACCAGFSTNANASCGGFKGEPSAMTVPATPQVQNHESDVFAILPRWETRRERLHRRPMGCHLQLKRPSFRPRL